MIDILIFFILPANVVLLIFLKYNLNLKLNPFLLLIAAYGIGPLLISLELLYLLKFFPGMGDFFYLGILISIFLVIAVALSNYTKKMLFLYEEIYNKLRGGVDCKLKKNIVLSIVVLILLLSYSIQAVYYPVVDNDNILYVNQAKGFYSYKNFEWKNNGIVTINENDEYSYNPSIQPALPLFLMASFLKDHRTDNYFNFQFIQFYYYILLLFIFVFSVYSLDPSKMSENTFYGIIFFIFSWELSRMAMYGSKESVIYFFTLLSLYLAYEVMELKERNYPMELLLGVVLGLNSFVNIHGSIIEIIILFLVLIFSRMRIIDTLKQLSILFCVSLPFGFFEFFLSSLLLFYGTFDRISHIFTVNKIDITENSGTNIKSVVESIDSDHRALYNINSFMDIYVRGKLQVFTNLGRFGFYFWFFITTFLMCCKEIFHNNFLRIIIGFIFVYYLFIIDPFNINSNPFAVVLYGSTKYAMLLVFLSMIITAFYFNRIVAFLSYVLIKYISKIFVLGISFFIASVVFKNSIIIFGSNVLFSVIKIYKGKSFYIERVEIIYWTVLVVTFVFLIGVYFINKTKSSKYTHAFISMSLLGIFILMPYCLTNPGKYSLVGSFKYFGMNQETQLKNILYEGGIFEVYFYAKNKIPKGSFVATDFNEIYGYNDYFSLMGIYREADRGGELMYAIKRECNGRWKKIYESKQAQLCLDVP